MEQSSIANKQQEEPLAVEATTQQQTIENASDATQGKAKQQHQIKQQDLKNRR